MTEREREREERPESEEELGGEELVDGRAGGTENVIDAEAASPGIGRTIGGVVVALIALILLALPVAWAIGALAAVSGVPARTTAEALTWVYVGILILLGLSAAYYAYVLLTRGRR